MRPREPSPSSGRTSPAGPRATGWSWRRAGRAPTCANCRRGDVTNCLAIQLMAFAYDGAWAEYTVAQAAGLTRVPDNVPLEQAAILADAVSTPFGAVVRTGKVGIGESVGVWGVGGVGTHIVQLARLVGAVPVIAVDIKPECSGARDRTRRRLRVRRPRRPAGARRSPRSPAAAGSTSRSTRSGSSRRSSRRSTT